MTSQKSLSLRLKTEVMSVILNKVQAIFRAVFEEQTLVIDAATTAEDIELWDSLTHMELITVIESAFSITFSLSEVMEFQDVGDMIQCIAQKLELVD